MKTLLIVLFIYHIMGVCYHLFDNSTEQKRTLGSRFFAGLIYFLFAVWIGLHLFGG